MPEPDYPRLVAMLYRAIKNGIAPTDEQITKILSLRNPSKTQDKLTEQNTSPSIESDPSQEFDLVRRRRKYEQRLAWLHEQIAKEIEPSDLQIAELNDYGFPEAERETAQIFYRRALLQEERREREEEVLRKQLATEQSLCEDNDRYDAD